MDSKRGVRHHFFMMFYVFLLIVSISVGCAGGPTATSVLPTAMPPVTITSIGKYKESPGLASLVKSGKLPPVDQRLPKNPLVVSAPEVGTYGGTWHRGFTGPSDLNGVNRVIYDTLVGFGPDGTTLSMKLAENITSSSDFKIWTVKLREGARWSDGSPFTADDIMFWYKDVLLNKDLTPSIPSWMLNLDTTVVQVNKVDDYKVEWTFKTPNTSFLVDLSMKDFGDKQFPVFEPSKYLKQFHASYANKTDLDKIVADNKLETWTELFALKQSPFDNPDRPGMAPWVAASGSRISDKIFKLVRNPYYVGVDTIGQQLPYLDEVDFIYFADTQALNLAAIAGELDQQERHIQLTNYPVLKEASQKNGMYNVYLWSSLGGTDASIVFNETYTKDPDLGKLFQNKDFRIAMSYAINRNQIKELVFLGTGEPRQPVPKKGHPYYPGDAVAYKYTEYNTNIASQMLDKLGLDKKDSEGYRLFPNGKRITIELSPANEIGPFADIAQLVAKDFERVGVKTIVQIRGRAFHSQLRQSNDIQAEVWSQDTAGFPFAGSSKYDPRTLIFSNFTTGPLWNQWYTSNGKAGVEPPADINRIVKMIDKARTVGPNEQAQIAQEMFTLWVENMYEIGIVGLTASDQGVVVVNATLHNVPQNVTKEWALRTPGNARPETWFYKK